MEVGPNFQAAVVSILLYGCTTWTLTKRLERRLDGNYTRMLRAVLNKSWRQHPTRLQLYGHLPPITKTIQVRRTRHAGHCWRSKDELISDVLLWTPTHGCARVGWPARTYIQQLCEDTGCNPEDLPEAMNDREKWRETVRDIRAGGATWWMMIVFKQWNGLKHYYLCNTMAPSRMSIGVALLKSNPLLPVRRVYLWSQHFIQQSTIGAREKDIEKGISCYIKKLSETWMVDERKY